MLKLRNELHLLLLKITAEEQLVVLKAPLHRPRRHISISSLNFLRESVNQSRRIRRRFRDSATDQRSHYHVVYQQRSALHG
ncbi:hypothetical protein Patl1_27342 [Pistacia atlantica]|uniref:Uncharacterized protein n=1 Tax=Pistacia atlantica TaxID=434234 RepID=A0ACC1BFA4_9ROSI|nr:hypothetical protein Patl1_27342 [Pistacia atlantica]